MIIIQIRLIPCLESQEVISENGLAVGYDAEIERRSVEEWDTKVPPDVRESGDISHHVEHFRGIVKWRRVSRA